MPDQPGRAVLYVRVSALMGRGGDTFLSPDIQLGGMRRALPLHGLREVGVVDDDLDVSGTTFERAGLDKVRAMAEARQFDVLVCYDTSRFGRDVLESLLFLRDLAATGVHIIAVAEAVDTSTDHGMSMLINMLNVAQMRVREIGRGWRQTIAVRAAAGKHHGKLPSGYRRGDDGRLVPDPSTAGPVRAAFDGYAAGNPVRQVRRRLCDQLGTHITESGFKRLLANEAYRGTVRAGQVRTEHAHDPLIDPDTWQRVQRRIARDRITPSRVLEARYWITGLGRCGRCEGPTGVTPMRRPGGQPRGHGVFCRDQRQGRGRCAGCGMLTLSYVEREVLRRVGAYVRLLRGDISAQQARLARAAQAGTDAATLQRQLGQTRAAMVRLTTRWAREERPDEAMYEAAIAELRADETRLACQLLQVQDIAAGPPPEKVANLAEELLRLWPQMQPAEQNQLLKQLVARIVVAPAEYHAQPAHERIEINWQ